MRAFVEEFGQLKQPARPGQPKFLGYDKVVVDAIGELQKQDEEIARARQAELAHAHSELERSPLPGLKALTTQVGSKIISLGARVGGQPEVADRFTRFAGAIEQAARERDETGFLPTWLSRWSRGAGVSMGTMIPAGMVGGPYGAITVAAMQETNEAIPRGREAGKEGIELAQYAVEKGVVEAAPAMLMQRFGMGGVESVFAKRAAVKGVRDGFKRLGITLAHEQLEEIDTTYLSNVVDYFENVDKAALSPERIRQDVADTIGQTFITAALMESPSLVRSMKAGQFEKMKSEMEESIKGNMAPSVRDWGRWGIPEKYGKSRRQRKAFVKELLQQVETIPPAPAEEMPTEGQPAATEAPEAAAELPVAPGEAAVAPEAPEIAPAPEAVTETPGAVEAPVAPLSIEETALNKATTDRIREVANLEGLNEEAVQHDKDVMAKVLNERMDERALDIAATVLEEGGQIDSHEHVALVVKADKLLTELEAARKEQSKAVEIMNEKAHKQAMKREKNIVDQLDELTAATRYSRREIARVHGIGRLRLSREKFDVASILDRMQSTKGIGKRLTDKDKKLAARLSREYADKIEKLEQVNQEIRDAEERRDEVLAGKILETNRPRRMIGRSIREKSIARQEDLKKRIRQLGIRVNDITGVSVEGTYLIGRMGIEYIIQGAGTLVEVAENLRRDLPDLELSQHDVNQALIARSPKEKVRARSEASKRVAKLKSMAKMEVAIEEMAQGIYEKIQRNTVPADADLKALKKKFAKLSNEYFTAERYDEKLVRARETINKLQDQLENGRKRIKETPGEVPPELAGLQDDIRQLRMELGTKEKLADLNEQLRTGEYKAPAKREKKPVNQKLQRMQTEAMRKRREIIQAIADTAPWDAPKVAKEIAFSLKAVAATADLSFTMRQNLWQVFAHPKLAAKAIGPSMKALFSEYKADEINNAILHSKNASLYEQAGVAILDANSPDAQKRSEVFRGRVVERGGKWNPIGVIMRASSRHAAVISNLIRTSAFDQFLEYNPNATQEEMRLMADYINVSTGLGNLGKFGAVGEYLQLGFFSPKFSVSRIELPIKTIQALTNRGKYKGMNTVRKQMARDMVGVVGTGMMVLALASLAGFDVEWLDPDDPDWGKIRAGNMRVDIWGGFQQPARVVARCATGTFRREDFDPVEIIGRFAAFKFSPAATVPVEMLTGKTAVGEETTIPETLARSAMPLVARDIKEAWDEHGIKGAAAAGALGTVGVGVSTYKDSETATRREIKKLQDQGKYSQAARLKAEWNRENPKNRIVTVK
jgi:hypothetical protein